MQLSLTDVRPDAPPVLSQLAAPIGNTKFGANPYFGLVLFNGAAAIIMDLTLEARRESR